MVGDLDDIGRRLRAMLPTRWFADSASNLSGLLTALGTPFAWLYTLLDYVITQSRLATATDTWLDMAAMDFFGSDLLRRTGEPDAAYRSRIQQTLLQNAVTRPAMLSAVQSLTGSAPNIFEPSRCVDTGVYGSLATSMTAAPPISYNGAGGWGSLNMPGQFFVSVTRPATPDIANLTGYGCSAGAYSEGQIAYVDLGSFPGTVSDNEIQDQIARLLPANATAWMRII